MSVVTGSTGTQADLSPWMNFGKELMSDFQTQYGVQSAVYQYLISNLMPMLQAGGFGFSNSTLAAMRTGASDTISTQFQSAQKALQNNTPQDAGLPSGVEAQNKAALAARAATAESGAQNNITLANEQQRQQNLQFAENGLRDVAAGLNPLGYAGAANQSGDVVANIENANARMVQANNTNPITQAVGKGLSSFLGPIGQGLGQDALSGLEGLWA